MSFPRIPQRKKRRWQQAIDPPFPVPIATISNVATSEKNWYYFTGELEHDHVVVNHSGDIHILHKMGFFGRGLLSQGLPNFYKRLPNVFIPDQGGDVSSYKVARRRLFLRHNQWKKSHDHKLSNEEEVEAETDKEYDSDVEYEQVNTGDEGQMDFHLDSKENFKKLEAESRLSYHGGKGEGQKDSQTVSSQHDNFWGTSSTENLESSSQCQRTVPMEQSDNNASWDVDDAGDADFWGCDDTDKSLKTGPSSHAENSQHSQDPTIKCDDLSSIQVEIHNKTEEGGVASYISVNFNGHASVDKSCTDTDIRNCQNTSCAERQIDLKSQSENDSKAFCDKSNGSNTINRFPANFTHTHLIEAGDHVSCFVNNLDHFPQCSDSGKSFDISEPSHCNSGVVKLEEELKDTNNEDAIEDKNYYTTQKGDSEAEAVPDKSGNCSNLVSSTDSASEIGDSVAGIVHVRSNPSNIDYKLADSISVNKLRKLNSEDVTDKSTNTEKISSSKVSENYLELYGYGEESASIGLQELNFQKHHPYCETEDIDGDYLVIDDSDEETEKGLRPVKQPDSVWKSVLKKDPYQLHEPLVLCLEEAFFLSYGLGCLTVLDTNKAPMTLVDLWQRCCEVKVKFLPHYVAYHYFRSKGWVPKPGILFGVDFILYKIGPPFYHGSYSVIVRTVHEGSLSEVEEYTDRKFTWTTFCGLQRVTEHVAKVLMVCYVIMPKGVTTEERLLPNCISKFKIKLQVINRWISSQERGREPEDIP